MRTRRAYSSYGIALAGIVRRYIFGLNRRGITEMTITLYTFPPSPPARAALMAARAVGVDVDVKEINLFAKEQLSPEFTKINPQHTVPTLVDDGFVMWESRAIAIYLVEKYGKDHSLYPQNPQLKAVVDQRLYFDCGTLYPSIRAICFPVLFLGETKISQQKRDALNEAIGYLEKFLHGRDWLTGNNCTVADISTYASLSSAIAMGWNIDAFPNVKKWVETCKKIPGYEENEVGAKMFGEAVRKNLAPGEL